MIFWCPHSAHRLHKMRQPPRVALLSFPPLLKNASLLKYLCFSKACKVLWLFSYCVSVTNCRVMLSYFYILLLFYLFFFFWFIFLNYFIVFVKFIKHIFLLSEIKFASFSWEREVPLSNYVLGTWVISASQRGLGYSPCIF